MIKKSHYPSKRCPATTLYKNRIENSDRTLFATALPIFDSIRLYRTLQMEPHNNSLELLKACAKNETEMALKLINSGVNLNIQDSNKTTPLHWCCYNGNDQLTQKLINQKAKQTSDKNGITPLHLAVLSGNSKIVEFLITIDDSLVYDCNEISPLHLAAYCGYNDIVETLTGPYDANETDKDDITPLHLAASCNHESTVKLLKAKGAELANEDCFRRSPVHWGAFCGNIEIIKGNLGYSKIKMQTE